MREYLDRAVILNCAFRCYQHNAAQEGSAKNSAHPMGAAGDIRALSGREKFEVIEAALACGCERFGPNYKTFVHVDRGDTMGGKLNAHGDIIVASPTRVIW